MIAKFSASAGAFVFLLSFPAAALANCEGSGPCYCVPGAAVCSNTPPSGAGGRSAAPAGPSLEQLRAQAEAKDLDEAAQDADDKGVKAYNRGDYAAAIKYFRQGLSYSPDSEVFAANLRKAQAKLAAAQTPAPSPQPPAIVASTDARRQLLSLDADKPVGDSQEANLKALSDRARQGFDTPGRDHGAPPPIQHPPARRGDPVVPPDRLTPSIAAMEKARARDRLKLATLNADLKALDPKAEPVKVAEVKQKISTVTSDVQYQNFSITEDLAKPPAAPKSGQTKQAAK
jgi:hypothetical protein